MTTEQIAERIKTLEQQKAELESSHKRTMEQFQKTLAENQNRHAQLLGAITELQSHLNQQNGDLCHPLRSRSLLKNKTR